MAFKEATDMCAGCAAVYGAPQTKQIMQFLNGNVIDCCEPVLPRDTIFTISDATDSTALIRFDATNITTCNTRVLTMADANVDLAALTACNIADNSIGLAQLTHGIDGELYTFDCAGAPAFVAVGTVGHFLRSGGTGVAPAFAALPCGATPTESMMVAASDETTALTTGLKITFHMPYAFTLTDIKGSLTTASCCGVVTVDVHEGACSIMACCKVQFDANETSTETAACPPIISDTSLADNAVMTIIVDAAGMCAAGLKVTLIGNQT